MVPILAVRRLGLQLNSFFEVRGVRLRIVGIYQCGHSLLDSGAVGALDVVQEIFERGDRLNLVLVRLVEGAKPGEVANAITQEHSAWEAAPTESWLSLYGHAASVES